MSNNMISVILPVYNGERYLNCAIDSVLVQEYNNFELIIVDDGSTDRTSEIIHSYTDPRIHACQQTNSGPGSARNYAMSLAKGDLFAFIDADDKYLPEKLAVQKESLDGHPEASVVWGDYFLADSDLQIQRIVSPDYITDSRENLLAYMLFRNVITLPPNIMFRRECYDAGFRYRDNVCHDEDYYLLLHLLEKYHFHYLDKPVYIYRRHENNLTNDTQMLHKREMEILSEYGPQKIDSIISATDFSQEDKLRLRGKLYMKFEGYGSAMSCFCRIPSDKREWQDYFYIGNNQYKQGMYRDAVHSYQNALELESNAPEIYNNLGCAYVCQAKTVAEKMFQRALSLFPVYGDANYNLSLVNTEQTKPTKDLLHFTKYELRKSIQRS